MIIRCDISRDLLACSSRTHSGLCNRELGVCLQQRLLHPIDISVLEARFLAWCLQDDTGYVTGGEL